MPVNKNLLEEYAEARRKLSLVKDELFSQLRDICKLCTNINSFERITDFHFNEVPEYTDEPEVIVNVTSYSCGEDTYHFPKRYLDMTLEEIKAETDVEYKQFLKLKEKFEKEKK